MYEKNLEKHLQLRLSADDMDYLVKESKRRKQSVGSVVRSFISYFRLAELSEVRYDTEATVHDFL